MDSSSAPHTSNTADLLVEEVLDALGLTPDEVPAPVVDRVRDRARVPDARLSVGRYLVVGELGRGGMGVVYEGWDPGIERRVAIKTIEPELVPEEDREEVVERFRRETRVVGRLKHPAIVTVFDSGRERARDPLSGQRKTVIYYYVMEFLEGRSLSRRLRDEGRLSERDAVRTTLSIAEALHLSHQAGIIHRDIKPSNIFMRDDRDAVLLDFGIAKAGSVALTRQGQILGTPSYLAPERLREKEVAIDGRADLFSLGVLLYTMLTGEAPFTGEDVYDVIDKITRTSHPEVDRGTPVGAALADILDRMLAKRPEDRFDDAAAAARALARAHHLIESDLLAPEDESEPDLEKTSPSAPTPLPPDDVTGPLPHVDLTPADLEIGAPETEVFDRGPAGPPPGASTHVDAVQPSAADPAEPSDTPKDSLAAVIPEPAGAAARAPVKAADTADTAGTRPELALLRQTREIRGGAPEGLEDFAEPQLEVTSPSVPPGVMAAITDAGAEAPDTAASIAAFDEEEGTADDLEGATADVDEAPPREDAVHDAIEDETVADPSLAGRVPSDLRAQPIVRAHQRQIATEQVVRASDKAHAEAETEAEQPLATPSVRPAPNRRRRSHIEASLVDEEDVVVRPASLDVLKPDELPTQTGYKLPDKAGAPQVLSADELVRTRADSQLQDPAESRPDRAVPEGARGLERRERQLSEPDGSVPELDLPKSAAVARRTFGPSPGRARAPSGVRVKGDPVFESFQRSRLIRRRVFLLAMATLASVAVGLVLGRMKRPEPPPSSPQAGLVPIQEEAPNPVIEPRGVKTVPGSDDLDLVRPRPAAELVKDAEAARLSGHLDDAARLFDSALRAAPDDVALQAKASLGRADVLRQLGQQGDAVRLYRRVAHDFPDQSEAEQAKVALAELGRPLRPKRAARAPAAPPDAPAPPAPEPATPEARCKAIVRAHLRDPRAAVQRLEVLETELPRAPCVSWYLGHKNEQLDRFGAALTAYRRYLELEPRSPRRAAVERKIRDLQAKLRQ